MSLLEARQLAFAPYPGLQHEISFLLEQGELLHLRGPSGVGKTTLLRTLVRLSAWHSGELLLSGRPASAVPATLWRRQVAYLPQRPVMLAGTVEDNLRAAFTPRAWRQLHGDFKREQAVTLLGELGFASPEDLLSRPAQRLSGGESARVALARALLLTPQALLADELTSQLDVDTAAAVVARCTALLAAGGVLLLVAHDETPWSSLLTGAKDLRLSSMPQARCR